MIYLLKYKWNTKIQKINLPHKTIAKYILNKNQVIKGYR